LFATTPTSTSLHESSNSRIRYTGLR
jgi:hypothetical protein